MILSIPEISIDDQKVFKNLRTNIDISTRKIRAKFVVNDNGTDHPADILIHQPKYKISLTGVSILLSGLKVKSRDLFNITIGLKPGSPVNISGNIGTIKVSKHIQKCSLNILEELGKLFID